MTLSIDSLDSYRFLHIGGGWTRSNLFLKAIITAFRFEDTFACGQGIPN